MSRILVVDDDPDVRALVRRFLTSAGYEVVEASTVMAGTRFLKQKAVDLILLDIRIPGIDGFTALARYREESSAPIVMLSSVSAKKEILYSVELGACDYILKPFGQDQLVARVAKNLGNPPTTAATVRPAEAAAPPAPTVFAWKVESAGDLPVLALAGPLDDRATLEVTRGFEKAKEAPGSPRLVLDISGLGASGPDDSRRLAWLIAVATDLGFQFAVVSRKSAHRKILGTECDFEVCQTREEAQGRLLAEPGAGPKANATKPPS